MINPFGFRRSQKDAKSEKTEMAMHVLSMDYLLENALDQNQVLVEKVKKLEAERDGLQHYIDCANTPLMRDVMEDRSRAEARVAVLEAALKRIAGCEVRFDGDVVSVARAVLAAGVGE